MKKIEFTNNKKIGKRKKLLTQIRLIVDIDENHLSGSLGGWVQSVNNLKNPDTGEIEGVILDDAEIEGNAKIYDNAILKDTARMTGNSKLHGNAIVGNDSRISSNVEIDGNVIIESKCLIYGNANITGNTHLISPRKFNKGTLSETPLQYTGSKYNMMLIDDILSMGCIVHKIDFWEKNLHEIALTDGRTEIEITEYWDHLDTAISSSLNL